MLILWILRALLAIFPFLALDTEILALLLAFDASRAHGARNAIVQILCGDMVYGALPALIVCVTLCRACLIDMI